MRKNNIRTRRTGSRQFSPADIRTHLIFALMWATYGDAGNEYVYPTFGVPPAAFYRRVLEIIATGQADPHLDPETLRRLERACVRHTEP